MTAADLDRIERELGLTLPDFYRRFMSDYPAQLHALRLAGRRVTSWHLADSPSRIIRLNRSVRARGRTFDGEPWPPEVLAIGDDGHGNYFAIDPPGESVFQLDSSDGKFYDVADSLSGFARVLIQVADSLSSFVRVLLQMRTEEPPAPKEAYKGFLDELFALSQSMRTQPQTRKEFESEIKPVLNLLDRESQYLATQPKKVKGASTKASRRKRK